MIMKKASLFYVLVLMAIFHLPFKTKAQISDPELIRFAEKFKKALIARNIDSMAALKPSPDIWRKLYPSETNKMTDKQIIDNINRNSKLEEDYNNIIQSAQNEKVVLEGLNFVDYKLLSDSPDGKLFGLELKFRYGQKDEVIFGLSVIRYENVFYLNDILMSYDIFKRYYFNR